MVEFNRSQRSKVFDGVYPVSIIFQPKAHAVVGLINAPGRKKRSMDFWITSLGAQPESFADLIFLPLLKLRGDAQKQCAGVF